MCHPYAPRQSISNANPTIEASPSTRLPARSNPMPSRRRSKRAPSSTPVVPNRALCRHIPPMWIVRRRRGRSPKGHPDPSVEPRCCLRPARDKRSGHERCPPHRGANSGAVSRCRCLKGRRGTRSGVLVPRGLVSPSRRRRASRPQMGRRLR